jgi:AcrR family transcriptional regulator
MGNPVAAGDARERILDAAYQLFSQNGIRAVGVEAVLERSGVARQTLYRHFDSKENLVLAFLERRDEVWTRRWLQDEVESRAQDPAERLLTIFDVFDEWFHRPDFEGCTFINVMLEHPSPADPINEAGIAYLAEIRAFLEDLARQAGGEDPDDLARRWHILMKGSIVAAGEGDAEAAQRAKRTGRLVLADAGLVPADSSG